MVIDLRRLIPGREWLSRRLRQKLTGSAQPEFAPRGSYYSPLPGYAEVRSRAKELFATPVDLGPSLNLRTEEQLALVPRVAALCATFDWPAERSTCRYYLNNGYFCIGDALVLHALLQHFRPEQVVEVGAGFSSALMLDINDRYLDRSASFSFVEPNAERLRSLLRPDDFETVEIFETEVHNAPPEIFRSLSRNDLLFIDSSHISKIGSDANYLLFEILPSLQPGVIIHFHDVFWPFEYPERWVMEGRAWNEAYFLHAFLQYNEVFRILFFNSYLGACFPSAFVELMPRFLKNTGGSLWLLKAK